MMRQATPILLAIFFLFPKIKRKKKVLVNKKKAQPYRTRNLIGLERIAKLGLLKNRGRRPIIGSAALNNPLC